MSNYRWSPWLLGASTLALVACTKSEVAKPPANPLAGDVKISLNMKGITADDTEAPAVCGTFTLTPYELAADGSQTLAGTAQIVTGTGPTAAPILGCIHTPGVSPDWRYVVTASDFVGCDSTVDGISPSVETFTVDVTCVPGQDISAQITAQVSIPVANGAGYIDVAAGVNVNTPQSGCKQADIDANGMLHFGQSYVDTSGGPTPSAYTGIGLFTPPATTGSAADPSTVQQFEGTVLNASETDAYFTGLLQLPAAPQSATLVQAFTQPCPSGEMTIQPSAVECVTNATATDGSSPSSTNTQVQIADVFAQWPGQASVSASITGAQTISLDTSLAGPNLGTLVPPVTGYDALTYTQALSVAPDTAIGLYGSLVHSDELLALVQDAALGPSLVVLELDSSNGQWSSAAPIALSTLSLAQQQDSGIFGGGGCFPMPVPACNPTAPVAQPVGSAMRSRPNALAAKASAKAGTNLMTDGPSATVNVTLTQSNGSTLDATHPDYAGNPVVAQIHWAASGLTPGQYAYLAVGLCDPYSSMLNTAGGSWIGASCPNGYGNNSAGNAIAITPVVVDNSGGVAEDLQLTLTSREYFQDNPVPSWVVPLSVYTTSGPTPQPGDASVPITGADSMTIPLTAYHTGLTQMTILSAASAPAGTLTLQGGAPNPAGFVFEMNYELYTDEFGSVSAQGNYLDGQTTIDLLPFAVSTGPIPSLVQGSATIVADGSSIVSTYSNIAPGLDINTDLAPLGIVNDPTFGAIPETTIQNMLGPSGYAATLIFHASWFIPIPAQADTLTTQGRLTWNGNVFTGASDYSVYPGDTSLTTIDEVPVANLLVKLSPECNEPTSDGSPEGPDTSCHWVYNWNGEESGEAWFMPNPANPAEYSAVDWVNPDYVAKLDPNTYISSAAINTNVPAATIISTSTAADCDNTNVSDTSKWTVQATPGSGNWSSVRCARYQFSGISSPLLNTPFTIALNSGIVSAASVNDTTSTTYTLWFTADNVIADGTGNAWAVATRVENWKNTTDLYAYNRFGTYSPFSNPASVLDVVGHTFEVYAAGLPLPDLTVIATIPPGAYYTSTDPATLNTWIGPSLDTDGATHATPNCSVDPASPRVLTCVLTPASGTLIAAKGSATTSVLQVQYRFDPNKTANNAIVPINLAVESSATWLPRTNGAPTPVDGVITYDEVQGPAQLAIGKLAEVSTTNAGATVAFDIAFGAGGLDTGVLGAGGVVVFDVFGQDFQLGQGGAAGTLVPQADGCVAPVPASVQFSGATGGDGTSVPQTPIFYYSTAATPNLTSLASWTLMPAGNIPAGATAIAIVPISSLSESGALLPADGTQTVTVDMASPSGATGLLCNSATLTSTGFNTTTTAEAQVTINAACDGNPWAPSNGAIPKAGEGTIIIPRGGEVK